MRIDRNSVRVALPPCAALALAALLTQPLAAATDSPLPTTGDQTTASQPTGVHSRSSIEPASPSCSTSKPATPACPPDSTLAHGGNVVVGIPAVAFTSEVVAVDGRLRAPVLLADDTVTAQTRVVGARTGRGCAAKLRQGVPVWLDCAISFDHATNPRILVTLSDGRTVVKAVTLG